MKKKYINSLKSAIVIYALSVILFMVGKQLSSHGIPAFAPFFYPLVPTAFTFFAYVELENRFADYATRIREFFNAGIEDYDGDKDKQEEYATYLMRLEMRLDDDEKANDCARSIMTGILLASFMFCLVPISSLYVALLAVDAKTVFTGIAAAAITAAVASLLVKTVLERAGFIEYKLDEYAKPAFIDTLGAELIRIKFIPSAEDLSDLDFDPGSKPFNRK